MSQLAVKSVGAKRKHSDENYTEAKQAMDEAKRANFSALTATNGITKTSNSMAKPAAGTVKKIVIKSFKDPKLPENYQVTGSMFINNNNFINSLSNRKKPGRSLKRLL